MSLLRIKTARRDFNEDISRWDVSSVKAVDFMFDRATSFNGDLSCWDATESNPGLIPLWDAVTSHSPAFASVESQAFRYTESAGAFPEGSTEACAPHACRVLQFRSS